ncbi:DUF1254 domain-containing protein [Pseudomonas sp. H9]|uniref:DUF1254 domain-containing protein n=1 Tax=Pseudomonas sp. H9 TaxID=483968 RepID=UPI00105811C8|nr:DUF1254 domain-containing protein [Pseudomonas sp. H9]TDF83983.1 DUF1254 domain-containing protein [Pseudomonas sp. H9]
MIALKPLVAAIAVYCAYLPVAHSQTLPAEAVTVTVDNFTRAETDRYFSLTAKRGGFGTFSHWRDLIPVDRPTVIRPNRDTLYSTAVFDMKAGPVSVTLPDAGGRFMSLVMIDEDHQVLGVHYGAGEYRLNPADVDTRYVMFGVRTLINPADPQDLQKIAALQDAIVAKQENGPGQFQVPNWDETSRAQIRQTLFALGATLPDSRGMFGKHGEVDPVRHLIGSAMAWGGNPEKDAYYQVVTPPHNDGKTAYQLKVADVPKGAFWSVSVYDAQGQFRKNPQGAYALNNLNAQKAEDGSVSVRFGDCKPGVANCLPIMPGWNYMVRFYQPAKAVLDGTWKLPEAQPAS